MAVNGIEIEVGQVWRTRGGECLRVESRLGHESPWVHHGYEFLLQDQTAVSSFGRYWPHRESENDLVELVQVNLVDGLAAATAEKFGASTRVSAIGILDSAANHMRDRAAIYDSPEGERSMGAAVTAFNAITKHTLTEAEGWLLLQVLKDVRLFQRAAFHQDSAEDCVAYAALKAEAKAKGGDQ